MLLTHSCQQKLIMKFICLRQKVTSKLSHRCIVIINETEIVLGSHTRASHKNLAQEPHTRASHKSLTQEPHTRASHKSLTQEPHTRASHKSLTQEPHTRASHKSLTQEPHTRASHKDLTQEPHTRASHKSLTQEVTSSCKRIITCFLGQVYDELWWIVLCGGRATRWEGFVLSRCGKHSYTLRNIHPNLITIPTAGGRVAEKQDEKN